MGSTSVYLLTLFAPGFCSAGPRFEPLTIDFVHINVRNVSSALADSVYRLSPVNTRKMPPDLVDPSVIHHDYLLFLMPCVALILAAIPFIRIILST